MVVQSGLCQKTVFLVTRLICFYSTDPKSDTSLKFDGKEVVVPQGKPKNNPAGSGSHFGQSEYLVYKESQNRIRYLLLMDFF